MPVGFRVGDHRLFIVDCSNIITCWGTSTKKCAFTARRLNTRQVATAKQYSEKGKHMRRSHVQCCCKKRSTTLMKNPSSIWYMLSLKSKESSQIESRYHPIHPFGSREHRCIVHFSVCAQRRLRIGGILKRAARKCGIRRPMHLTLLEIKECLQVCESKCEYFCHHSHKYRRTHLSNVLERAGAKEDDVAKKRFSQLSNRKKTEPSGVV